MKLESLTGLRALAAVLVFGWHIADMGKLDSSSRGNMLSAGMVGVSFFFMVSGFVLAWTARPADSAKLFYRRRLARIYPAYFVAWLVALAWLFLMGQVHLVSFLPITLLQSWISSEAVYFAANPVFWSLSTEAFFYLLFPGIFPLMKVFNQRGRAITMGLIVVIIFALALMLDPKAGSVGFWLLYIFPPTRLLEFILGILMALHIRDGWRMPLGVKAATLMSVVGYAIAVYSPFSIRLIAVMLIPFAVLITAVATADIDGSWSPYRGRIVTTLGMWSYAFYLAHIHVIASWGYITGKFLGYELYSDPAAFALAANILVCLGISTLAAAALHLIIEAPIECLLRPAHR